jgi:hypothetical protein
MDDAAARQVFVGSGWRRRLVVRTLALGLTAAFAAWSGAIVAGTIGFVRVQPLSRRTIPVAGPRQAGVAPLANAFPGTRADDRGRSPV